jgi:spore coat-associated protein N
MNKTRALASLVLIGAAAASMGYGTNAYFVDTETSTRNIFSAGGLDLHIDGTESVQGTIGATDFVAGDVTPLSCITLSSTRSNAAPDLDIYFETQVTDAVSDPHDPDLGGPSAHAFDTFLVLDVLTYDGADLLTRVGDADGDGRPQTLADAEMATAAGGIVDLAAPESGRDLCLQVRFDADGGADLIGDSVDLTLRFILAQSDAPDVTPGS